jgi:hypothetical protein
MKRHIYTIAILTSGVCVGLLPAQVTVDSSADLNSMVATNGNKVTASGSGLHAVYVKAGAIYYTWSGNSQTWAAGIPITASGASAPAIAVASDGTVGVVYALTGNIWYQSCKPATLSSPCSAVNWKAKAPMQISPGSHPSLTAYQTDMYMAAAAGGIVIYAKFAAATGVLAGGWYEYAFYDSGTCYQDTVDFPGVTVTPASPPEIRVSWLQKSKSSGDCPGTSNYVGVYSAKRQPWGSWGSPDFWSSTNWITADLYSLSVAQNVNTGDLLMAASWMLNNVQSTMFFRRSQAGTWYNSLYSNLQSLIDIESDGASCGPQIRIAYTNPSAGSYGNTYYRTGSWTGAAATPSWNGGSMAIDSAGTSPQALFWNSPMYFSSGSIYAYSVPVFWARAAGASESVEVQSIKVLGGVATCPAPLPPPLN